MPRKILLVDDDVDTLRLIGLMLQRQGYEVRSANSGVQAISMVAEELPDLILLDVMMPEMDGYEVARRLRSQEQTANLPIIMFTAKSQADDKVKGYEAGADDYLTKPTQPKELFAHLKAVMVRSERTQRPAEDAQQSQRGQLIGVIAPKGGVGVSTLTVNLGVALHTKHGKSVIVADFRPGQGTIGLELGFLKTDGSNALLQRSASEITTSDVLACVQDHPCGIRLLLASHNPSDTRYAQQSDNFLMIAKHLTSLAQVVLLDLGASLTPTNLKIIPQCQQIIMVSEPSQHTLVQSKLMLRTLHDLGIASSRINIAIVKRTRAGTQLNLNQIQEHLGKSVAVVFSPAPELAFQASVNKKPLYLQQPDSLITHQFSELAEQLAERLNR